MRILIVEDNALLAFMIEDALSAAGHEVFGPAGELADAIGLAIEFRPELAIVDIDLADHASGVEIARDLSRSHGVPSLFSSGQVETARLHTDVALGILCKPYSPETIVRAVAILSKVLAGEQPGTLPRELELFVGPEAKSV
jgi:DNA-binding response OmpR family regulator